MLQFVDEEEECDGEAVQGREIERRLTVGEFCVFAAELHCQSLPYTPSQQRKRHHQVDRSV